MFYIVYYDMAGKQIPHNIIPRDVKETEVDYYTWPKSFVPVEEIADPADDSREKIGKSKKEKYWDVLYQTPWTPPVQKELITVLWEWVAHTIPIEEISEYKVIPTHQRKRNKIVWENDNTEQQIHDVINIPYVDAHVMNEKYEKKKKNTVAKNSKRRNQKTKSYRPRQWTEDEMNKYYKKIQYYKVKNRVPL